MTEVYRAVNARVDIILVHGLNGDPEKTWTHKNGCFWPSQLLPDSLRGAPARVLVYGYNADVYAYGSSHHVSSDLILHHAQTLVNAVVNERESEGMGDNAIIWVAHSLGGILVKKVSFTTSHQHQSCMLKFCRPLTTLITSVPGQPILVDQSMLRPMVSSSWAHLTLEMLI